MRFASRLEGIAQRLDASWLGWPFRAGATASPRISPILTTDPLTAAIAASSPVADRLLRGRKRIEPSLSFSDGACVAALAGAPSAAPDRIPELAAEPGPEEADRIPQRIPKKRGRTPAKPRRALHWYERPDPRLTFHYVVNVLPFDEDGKPCEGPPMDARHGPEVHALRLLMSIVDSSNGEALDDPPIANASSVERGLFAYQIEQQYFALCTRLWWRPYRWGGTNGVAQHFRRLVCKPRTALGYKYLIKADGSVGRGEFYPLPRRSLGTWLKAGKRTPKRAPKAGERTPRTAPASAPARRAA